MRKILTYLARVKSFDQKDNFVTTYINIPVKKRIFMSKKFSDETYS